MKTFITFYCILRGYG